MSAIEPLYGHLVKFHEAIDFLKNKLAIPTDSWKDMQGGIHAKAFTIAGATKLRLLSDFQNVLVDMLSDGKTANDFLKDFDSIVKQHGWSYKGSRGWRSQTIYQNNLNTARAAGRWQQQERTKAKRPYLLYLTAGDLRVRKEHARWDYILLPLDDPFWRTHYPPNGWRCRCKVISLSMDDIDRMGLVITDSNTAADHLKKIHAVDTDTGEILSSYPGVDLGWDYNPGLAWMGHDIALGKTLVEGPGKIRDYAIPEFNKVLAATSSDYKSMINNVAAKIALDKPVNQGQKFVIGHLSSESITRIMTTGPISTSVIVIDDKVISQLLKSGISIEVLYRSLDVGTGAHKLKRGKGSLVELTYGGNTITVELGSDFNKVKTIK